MRRIVWAVFVLMCVAFGFVSHLGASENEKPAPALGYDRLERVERLLKALYPDLAHQLAMVKVDATLEDNRGIVIDHLKLYPCRPSANVSSRPTTDITPLCGNDPPPELEHFLGVSVEFLRGFARRPIRMFSAGGDYVSGKLQAVREQFAGKPYQSEDEEVQVLLSRNPRFGPKNKKEFLAVVPWKEIHEITGCALRPESVIFVVELNPLYLPPDLQWHIFGTNHARGLPTEDCRAVFEPFDGHLTLFMD